MFTSDLGREAEKRVAIYLKKQGHKIVEQNWRTRWCEIDVISTYEGCVYFTEVKFRGSSEWGSGFDYITPQKMQQMRFAAEFWLHKNDWSNESCLQAAEVDHNLHIQVVEIS